MMKNQDNLLEREQAMEITARETFFWARRRVAWHGLRNCLVQKPNRLESFSTADGGRKLIQQHALGTHSVALERIVGSVGRVEDFDRDFFPRNTRTINRWLQIALAFYKGIGLPAVELIKVDDNYYVKDGHHRISVASTHGQTFIDAAVTQMVFG